MVRNGDADLHLFGVYKAGWPVGCRNVSDYPSIRPDEENYSRHFRHDYMAKMMNINMRLFADKYKDVVEQVKRCVLRYVKSMREAADERDVENEAADTNPAAPLKITELGYPILPDVKTWKAGQKKDLERVVRTYLSMHYSKLAEQ